MDEKKEFIADDAERLLSLEEVGARLGTGRAFVGRLIKAGLIDALAFRKVHRIPKSELSRFVRDHTGQDIYTLLEAAEGAAM